MLRLARELGMTKRRLIEETDSRDIAEWMAFFSFEKKDEDRRAAERENPGSSPAVIQAKMQALVPKQRK